MHIGFWWQGRKKGITETGSAFTGSVRVSDPCSDRCSVRTPVRTPAILIVFRVFSQSLLPHFCMECQLDHDGLLSNPFQFTRSPIIRHYMAQTLARQKACHKNKQTVRSTRQQNGTKCRSESYIICRG
jgi:hypothetical protein